MVRNNKNKRINKTPKKSLGFSLIEIMITIVIVMAGVVGVYLLLSRASASAAVQQEQQQVGTIVQQVKARFMASSDYSNLSTSQFIQNSQGQNLGLNTFSSTQLRSAFNTPIVLRPATVYKPNDAFDMVYKGLNTKQCTKLIPALYTKSHNILVGEGSTPTESVQDHTGISSGHLKSGKTITQACNKQAFQEDKGTVVFRIYSPRNVVAGQSTTGSPITQTCQDQTQQRQQACLPGEIGHINQERQGTCNYSTGTMSWGSWTTVSDTCTDKPIVSPPVNPGSTCTPRNNTKTFNCSSGKVGQIVKQQVGTCDASGNLNFTGWTVVSNTCHAQPTTSPTGSVCTPYTDTQTLSCPAGMSGSKVQKTSYTCASPSSTPQPSTPVIVSNTCSSIVTTMCKPEYKKESYEKSCASGSYGRIYGEWEKRGTCPTPTGSVQWPSNWTVLTTHNDCHSCPATTTDTKVTNTTYDYRTKTRTSSSKTNPGCAANETGQHYWYWKQERKDKRKVQTIKHTKTSYDCSPSPKTLPSPDVSTWNTTKYGSWQLGSWTNTSTKVGEVNTCKVKVVSGKWFRLTNTDAVGFFLPSFAYNIRNKTYNDMRSRSGCSQPLRSCSSTSECRGEALGINGSVVPYSTWLQGHGDVFDYMRDETCTVGQTLTWGDSGERVVSSQSGDCRDYSVDSWETVGKAVCLPTGSSTSYKIKFNGTWHNNKNIYVNYPTLNNMPSCTFAVTINGVTKTVSYTNSNAYCQTKDPGQNAFYTKRICQNTKSVNFGNNVSFKIRIRGENSYPKGNHAPSHNANCQGSIIH